MSREAFEAWAKSEGLITDRHGVMSTNSMCGVADKAWQAALAWAYEDAARFCESNCAGISYANGNQGPCLTEFPKECGGRHDGMTYAEAIRERAKEVCK